MSVAPHTFDGDTLTIFLSGAITSKNVHTVEDGLRAAQAAHPASPVVLDCSDLSRISSAGLRLLLRLKKSVPSLTITNVSPDVYQVFEVTGFTMLVDIRTAYREISVSGCRIIGRGANGILYRLDAETVCKVYIDPDSVDDILRERELAKTALVAGIPTAISFDVVRVGDSFGSVFELLNADSMLELLAGGAWDVEDVADAMAGLLILMSQTTVDAHLLPSALSEAHKWVDLLEGVVDGPTFARLSELVDAMPDEGHLVHGDFHMGNVMVLDDEPLLIDMDTLSHGNAVFDLESAYSAYVGRGLLDREDVERYLGIPYELSCHLWDLMLRRRFPDAAKEQVRAAEDKVRLLSALRLMGRPLRHRGIDKDVAQRTYEVYGQEMARLLDRVDSLAV